MLPGGRSEGRRRLIFKQSAAARSGDLGAVTLFSLLAVSFVYVLVRYVIVPADIAFLNRLAMTVLAVAVEAVPFLLIGSVISALIDLYVSEEAIARIIPAKAVTGVLAASVLGVVLPVCDCATVPIVRRLVAKGVPLHVAITFMLAVPMINPLVVFSTWFAFYQYPRFLLYRMGFGLASAIAVGLLMSLLDGTRQLRVERALEESFGPQTHQHHHHHPSSARGFLGHVAAITTRASEDFYDMGRYFLVGVILSSIVQSVVPQSLLYTIGHWPIASLVVMVGAAYVLSVCSQADAFIARTFMSQFSPGAIIAFLIFGPMIDLKNTLMLSAAFKKRFIALLILVIAAVSILSGYLVNLGPRG